jgi:hypothetical protein
VPDSEQQHNNQSSAAVEREALGLSLADEPSTFVVVLEGGAADA